MEIKIPYGKTFQTLNIEEGFELLESKIQELEGFRSLRPEPTAARLCARLWIPR